MESVGSLPWSVLILRKRWCLIRDTLLIAVAFALVAFLVQPDRYEATARVAILKIRSEVTFDPKFKTTSPEDPAAEIAAQRSTLANLVENPVIARDVIDSMGSQLPQEWRDPEVLVKHVKGSLTRERSNLVQITADSQDAAVAAALANTWAAAYESYINHTFAGTYSQGSSLNAQLTTAKQQYDRASESLIAFTASSRINLLTSQIDDKKNSIAALQEGRKETLVTLIGETTKAKTEVLNENLAALLRMEAAPANERAKAEVLRLSDLYARKLKIDNLLRDASALRDQASKPGASAASSSLAITLLKTQVASSVGLPGTLQVQVGAVPGEATNEAQVHDLDALVEALRAQSRELDAEIQRQSRLLLAPDAIDHEYVKSSDRATSTLSAAQQQADQIAKLAGLDEAIAGLAEDSTLTQAVERLSNEITALETELAAETARKEELTHARDLAWETYTTLAAKAEEMDIATQLPGDEVRFVMPATRPVSTVTQGTMAQGLGAALVIGLLLGLAGALGLEYLSPNAPTPHIPWTAPFRLFLRRLHSAGRAGSRPGSLEA